jgi:hypothetical protein
MATSDEIGGERQRVSEQLARLDAERAKLANELNELEIAERVLTRFGKAAGTIERRRRERPARTAPVALEPPRARRRREAPTVALRDAVLRAVEAYRGGATANDVLTYLSREFGMNRQAEPPRDGTAAAPACRSTRTSRSTLVPAPDITPSHRWPFSSGRLRLRIAALWRPPGLSEAVRGRVGIRSPRTNWAAAASTRRFPRHRARR